MPDPAPGPRPAWYAVSSGSVRDWVTILHLPYTSWHLSYVLIGAALAPRLSVPRLLGTLLAFALAVGVAAHALDEWRGRPLGTAIPSRVLLAAAALSLAGAVAIGIVGIARVGAGLVAFIALGVVFVVGYNLELWGGRLHNDAVFALAWGSFPLLTAYFAQTGTIRLEAAFGALFAYGLSRAQRVLSTDARQLRRRVRSVTGQSVDADGTRRSVTRESLLRPLERALVALSWSVAALGIAMVLSRTGP
ncbi:MAG: hypothetical protein JO368_10420 [Acidimicrobiales bacterium]|nr:hypothetical protein [Acidimicrobiales bacterium]